MSNMLSEMKDDERVTTVSYNHGAGEVDSPVSSINNGAQNAASNEAVTLRTNGHVVPQRGDCNGDSRTRCESVTIVSSSDLLRKRDDPYIEDESLRCPIKLLPGENLRRLGRGAFGEVIMLTTYRLFITYSKSFVNIPLSVIESADCKDISSVSLLCKDGTVQSCTLPTSDACFKWLHAIKLELSPVQLFVDYFACAFSIVSSEGNTQPWEFSDYKPYKLGSEIKRLGFNLKTVWRITNINDKYSCCSSYPKENLVPKDFEDSVLKTAASFRTLCRFPSAVWRHKETGAVLLRSSQPVVGVFCQRNTDDENLIQSIIRACGCSDRLLIVDARSYTAAVANRAKGGGCEYTEYYNNCDIEFMNLPNIHAIRASFNAVRSLVSSDVDSASWYSLLDSSKWIANLSLLLQASKYVAKELTHRPVLVHCSDGWDRTPQIVSLAQLILDPYYRTFKGFQMLIEKEWLLFGHKFAHRCGHALKGSDPNEISPVFLQWLDAVYQLTKQFPTAFEFNEAYLMKLAQHIYSCMFGTFLFNNEMEREKEEMSAKTTTVWSLLNALKTSLSNRLYSSGAHKVLNIRPHTGQLVLWTSLYGPHVNHTSSDISHDETPGLLQRSHSYTDISTSTESNLHLMSRSPRRVSDPDLCTSLNLGEGSINGSGTIPPPPPATLLSNELPGSATGSSANIVSNGFAGQSFESRSRNSSNASSRDPDQILKEKNEKKVNGESGKEEFQYSKYIDIDGLTLVVNPAQQKLDEIMSRYEKRIEQLEQQIKDLQSRPPHSPSSAACCRNFIIPHGQLSGVEAVPSSAGSNCSAQSDSSWENVSPQEPNITLWIPDHAVTYCSSCNVPFKVFRRKHHCRHCGQVFCQSCAAQYAAIPQQQLYEPVRVCKRCHSSLVDSQSLNDEQLDEADILDGALNPLPTYNGISEHKANENADIALLPCSKPKPIPVKNSKTSSYNADSPVPFVSKLAPELSSSQVSLQSNGGSSSGAYDGLMKTCSQESINVEHANDGKRLMGARAEC